MSNNTNYQLLKMKKANNDYFKSIVEEVGLDYQHLDMKIEHLTSFRIIKKDEIIGEFPFCQMITFFYSGFELTVSFHESDLVHSDLIRRFFSRDTNNSKNKEINGTLFIKKYGNYKKPSKIEVHAEILNHFTSTDDMFLYVLNALKKFENEIPKHSDVTTSTALMGLNLPQDFLPSFMTISGFDVDYLKGSKRNIGWYTSDEDGKGFDMNIHKSNSHLVSPYIREFLSYDYYVNFNNEKDNESYNFSQKTDFESLMNDILYFIENNETEEELEDNESISFLKELLENDEICNDYMLDCLYAIGDFDNHTQPSATFYEVVMNNNFVMDSDTIEYFKEYQLIEYTTISELIISSLETLDEVIINGEYSVSN